jgi:hypothetical protein
MQAERLQRVLHGLGLRNLEDRVRRGEFNKERGDLALILELEMAAQEAHSMIHQVLIRKIESNIARGIYQLGGSK